MTTALQAAQHELDDIRHILHQWYEAGLPGDGESVVAAPGAAATDTPAQPDIKGGKEAQKEFDDAFEVLRSQYGIMREFGGNTLPPEGQLDAEIIQSMGNVGHKASLDLGYAFYGLLELYNRQCEREIQS